MRCVLTLLLLLTRAQCCVVDWARQRTKRVALVVRGVAYRDCGHGVACDAKSESAQRYCARSHVRHFVEPAEKLGLRVDVFVATYACPNRSDWTQEYRGDAREVVVDAADAARASSESQLDSVARALSMLQRAYDGVVMTRNDLYFLNDLSPALARQEFLFHADVSAGARVAYPAHRNVSAVTDKLHVVPGAALDCFRSALPECFNNGDDDGDPRWISGEHCYEPVARRLGASRVAFLRDCIGHTRPDTFGDNGVGDGVYLVLPRAFGAVQLPRERQALLRHDEPIGPYATGHCLRGSWVAPQQQRRGRWRRREDYFRRSKDQPSSRPPQHHIIDEAEEEERQEDRDRASSLRSDLRRSTFAAAPRRL
mmetsp:Transcript_20682/g.63924  ORF Transcript_20682/g.63924 Transcript_20682/m.63924 type:complete len:368 (-) Transcript_20682:72-1175(-)